MFTINIIMILLKNKNDLDLSYIKCYKYNKIEYFANQYFKLLKN